MKILQLENRQRAKRLNRKFLKTILQHALEEELKLASYETGIHLVGTKEMARVNQDYLNHEGSTDVITFDYKSGYAIDAEIQLHGEIYISVPDAILQAEQFQTTWQEELTRYALHGFLHLLGYDDLEPAARRLMKRKENTLVRKLTGRFDLNQIGD